MAKRTTVRAPISARAETVPAQTTRETASLPFHASIDEEFYKFDALVHIDDTKQYLFYTKCIYLKLL